ncbi:glycosyltransferase family 39 protein [Geomonas subterranea]|uniref:Glycosyltransferase family 39 protein n=1 Tax=Geomonas subterranea TaxID=2847989 RepID=A0ABX8LKW3_9BACT|nr:glycosyltransferase family 39 protein [Geomonas subterranea]QXE92342.1 glycosyltransferase family 39 protein [Geomonas subterranea]QXM09559.1 glycosyltransferase family 39 protein [Geomonas subterranea]
MRFSLTSTTTGLKKQALFLVVVVLAVYSRAVFGTVVSIDDVGIMKFYGSQGLRLTDALTPGQGYYYRPVIALSFYLDHLLFGQNPIILHLENILIHAANAVLVLLLGRRLLPESTRWAPLVAALLFAVHPVNSEAVSWIAGRTDPLAASFVLLACISLLKGMETGRMRHTVASIALLVAGVMTKETAIVFVPASLLLIALLRHLHPGLHVESVRMQARVLVACYLLMGVLISAVLLSRTAGENSLAKLLIANIKSPAASLLLGGEVFGFYVKKMFLPWPLSFAIVDLSAWYLVAAVAGVLFCLFARRSYPTVTMLCIGALFLLPAVAVGVFDVAWTVAAERYLYIPSAFFAIGLTGYAAGAPQLRERLALIAVFCCIAAAGFATWHRTGIWGSNIALFEDSIATSPTVGMLHHELAIAYAKAGRYAEAAKELEVASSLNISEMLKRMIRKDRLLVRLQGVPPEEKRRLINLHGWNLVKQDKDLLEILRANDYLIVPKLGPGPEKAALISELVTVSEALFALTGDPILLYNNGQLLLESGDRGGARASFVRCATAAPRDAYYIKAALKLAAALEER